MGGLTGCPGRILREAPELREGSNELAKSCSLQLHKYIHYVHKYTTSSVRRMFVIIAQ
jgi:hypothetical protein